MLPSSRATVYRFAMVTLFASAAVVGGQGMASALEPASQDGLIGRTFDSGPSAHAEVMMDDPWVFRGPTKYDIYAASACWSYGDRSERMVDVSVSNKDRYFPTPFNMNSILYPVDETLTVDWTDLETGEKGRAETHSENGNVTLGLSGTPSRYGLDIHLRSDQPWLRAAGSTELPFGHSEGSAHLEVDSRGPACR
ncbi:hypothetical protein [Dietzia sp.]|uniref:hypothetical protein n=1 Tax=Dietzia sp. TaxID=1871616 RepID=UPI002FD957B3